MILLPQSYRHRVQSATKHPHDTKRPHTDRDFESGRTLKIRYPHAPVHASLGKPELEESLSQQGMPVRDIRALVLQLAGTGIDHDPSESLPGSIVSRNTHNANGRALIL
jgi:hypothetical protein